MRKFLMRQLNDQGKLSSKELIIICEKVSFGYSTIRFTSTENEQEFLVLAWNANRLAFIREYPYDDDDPKSYVFAYDRNKEDNADNNSREPNFDGLLGSVPTNTDDAKFG